MQSLSSVTKGQCAVKGNKKKILTEYKKSISNNNEGVEEINSNYRNMSEELVNQANREKEKIILEAMEKAKGIERQAYEKAYEEGYNNGIEDGRRETVEKIIPNAEEQAKNIVFEAEKVLKQATRDYEEYLNSKKQDILSLSLEIAEKILYREIEDKENFIGILDNALLGAKGEKTVLIRCNEEDVDIINDQIDKWKLTLGIKEGIFTIKDNIRKGEVLIEKETGIIKVGIQTGIEKIKQELFR